MGKIPTARELLYKRANIDRDENGDRVFFDWLIEEVAIEFAQLHVQAALEAASENVKKDLLPEDQRSDSRTPSMWDVIIDKDSIVNAYPLDQIK